MKAAARLHARRSAAVVAARPGCSRVDVEAGGLAATLLRMCCAGAEETVMSPTRSSRLRVFGVSRTRPSHRARISPTSPTTVEATGMAQIGLLQDAFKTLQYLQSL